MNLGEIHVGEMLAANASDLHTIHDGQAKFYREEIVDAASGRAGIDERLDCGQIRQWNSERLGRDVARVEADVYEDGWAEAD